MSSSIAVDDPDLFVAAAAAVFDSWTALRMIVSGNGSTGAAFADWLPDATAQWFSENKDLTPEEVEIFLEDMLAENFNVGIEDGSLTEVSHRLCSLHSDCVLKSQEEVLSKLASVPKCDLSRCQVKDDDGYEGGTNGVQQVISEERSDATNESTDTGSRRPQPDEDGWTTVHRKKKS